MYVECCYVYYFLFFFLFLFFLFISVFWVMLLGAERIRIESNRNWNRTENIKIGVDFLQFISISNVDSISCFWFVVCVYVCVCVCVFYEKFFWEGLLLLYMLFLFFNCLLPDVIWQKKSFIRLLFRNHALFPLEKPGPQK